MAQIPVQVSNTPKDYRGTPTQSSARITSTTKDTVANGRSDKLFACNTQNFAKAGTGCVPRPVEDGGRPNRMDGCRIEQ
jgi:hypothetical protein